MIINTFQIRVRYADTDQMKRVYNGKFLEYFEIGRTELIRELGLSYDGLEKNGFLLPVIEAYVKYFHPADYDELLNIESTLKDKPLARLKIEYVIKADRDSRVIATGYTTHAFLDAHTLRVVRSPELFNNLIDKYFEEK